MTRPLSKFFPSLPSLRSTSWSTKCVCLYLSFPHLHWFTKIWDPSLLENLLNYFEMNQNCQTVYKLPICNTSSFSPYSNVYIHIWQWSWLDLTTKLWSFSSITCNDILETSILFELRDPRMGLGKEVTLRDITLQLRFKCIHAHQTYTKQKCGSQWERLFYDRIPKTDTSIEHITSGKRKGATLSPSCRTMSLLSWWWTINISQSVPVTRSSKSQMRFSRPTILLHVHIWLW